MAASRCTMRTGIRIWSGPGYCPPLALQQRMAKRFAQNLNPLRSPMLDDAGSRQHNAENLSVASPDPDEKPLRAKRRVVPLEQTFEEGVVKSSRSSKRRPKIGRPPATSGVMATWRRMACPIHKHNELHGHSSSCNWVGGKDMYDVAKHLRSYEHRHDVSMCLQCTNCWSYVTDPSSYFTVHMRGLCDRRSKGLIRWGVYGDRGSRWQVLYRQIYPQSTRIPNACKFMWPSHHVH